MGKKPHLRKGFTRTSGLFAFWEYDTFPYLLGGPVMAMNDEGIVQVETYAGSCFKPFKLMTRQAGMRLLAKLMELRQQHRMAEQSFRDEWYAKVVELVPEMKEK